jgi:hypothetical protein
MTTTEVGVPVKHLGPIRVIRPRLASSEIIHLTPSIFHDLIAEVVDDLDGDAARFGFILGVIRARG